MFNYVFIVSGIGIIQSLIFSLFIIQKKNKRPSDWILLFWFLVFSIHLALIMALNKDFSLLSLTLAKTFGLLHGPLFLIYTQAVFNSQPSQKTFLHLLPFLIFLIVGLSIKPEISDTWDTLLVIIKSLSLIMYPLYIRFWLVDKLNLLKTYRADGFLLDSIWIKTLAILFLIYASVGILHVLADVLFGVTFSIILDIVLYVSMVTIIGFYGLKFRIVYESEFSESNPLINKDKYQNSPLKRGEILEKRKKIDAFFENTKAYLNPDFSLTILSERLGIPKHHLSEIINLDMGTTFYDIINAKRIQYAVQRLTEGSDKLITLEGLGYECGYKTKSAFYHHFKRFTGKTPGKFRSEISTD